MLNHCSFDGPIWGIQCPEADLEALQRSSDRQCDSDVAPFPIRLGRNYEKSVKNEVKLDKNRIPKKYEKPLPTYIYIYTYK